MRGHKLFSAGILASVLVRFASAASVSVDGSTVYVNELKVLTLRAKLGAERAQSLAALFERLSDPAKIVAVNRIIKNGATVIAEISDAEAAAQQSDPAGLAKEWARNLKQALSLPALKVDTRPVKLAGSGEKLIAINGQRAKTAKVDISDSLVATLKRVPGGVLLQAKGFGTASVVVSAGDSLVLVPVKIIPPAASLPQALSATVVGRPATTEMVRGAIAGAIYNQLKTVPESSISFSLPEISPLNPDRAISVTVPVQVSGQEAFTTKGNVQVVVRNENLEPKQEGELWYCNYPENVKGPSTLFSAQLKSDEPARLLYHHYNASYGGIFIDIQAINGSDLPARIAITPGDSKPDKNPVLAGIDAGEKFVRNWMRASGEIVTIPPHSTIPIAFRRLAPKETMSGLCCLRLLDGPSQIDVVAAAKNPFALNERWTQAMKTASPWRLIGPQKMTGLTPRPDIFSQFIYPDPFKNEDLVYSVGGKHGFVRIGEEAINRADNKGVLEGNFGVVYTINARTENLTDQTVECEMVFEASAGYSGALFVVNGQLIRTPLIGPKAEVQVAKMRLEPGSRKLYTVLTIPLSGSSYPATFSIRPVDSTVKFATTALASHK